MPGQFIVFPLCRSPMIYRLAYGQRWSPGAIWLFASGRENQNHILLPRELMARFSKVEASINPFEKGPSALDSFNFYIKGVWRLRSIFSYPSGNT